MKRKFLVSISLVATLLILFAMPASAHEGVGGDEYAAAGPMLVIAFLFVLMSGFGIIFSWYNGEFKNPEEIKRRMIELASLDDDGEDLPEYALTEA
jgi:hypothetical protein